MLLRRESWEIRTLDSLLWLNKIKTLLPSPSLLLNGVTGVMDCSYGCRALTLRVPRLQNRQPQFCKHSSQVLTSTLRPWTTKCVESDCAVRRFFMTSIRMPLNYLSSSHLTTSFITLILERALQMTLLLKPT